MDNESMKPPDPSTEKPVPSHENTSDSHDDQTGTESADRVKDEEPDHVPAGDSRDDTRAKTMPAGDPDPKDEPLSSNS